MEDAPQALGAHLGAQQSTETSASLRCTQHPWGDTEPWGWGAGCSQGDPTFCSSPRLHPPSTRSNYTRILLDK